ncbi:MAG TPA: hypothetical protein PLD86_08095 [Vicinamibacteria bacterium]|nr:hypothetical protein [Vicinamibacteria bacterium]
MRNTLHALGLAVLMSLPLSARAADEPAKTSRETALTLGAIQRSMKTGMSTAEVVETAGSPNLVTRGRNGRESWVYDRFATETSEEGFQVGGGGMGGGGSFLGALGVGGGRKKSSTSQRTLMLLVTFGPDGMVESFTYRSSKF